MVRFYKDHYYENLFIDRSYPFGLPYFSLRRFDNDHEHEFYRESGK